MRRMTVVAMAAAGAAVLLAGCTPAVPVAGVAEPVEVTAAVTDDQSDRVQSQTFEELAVADEAKSTKTLDVRVGGDAKVVRGAEYKQQSADDGPKPDVLPSDMQAVYVTSAETWPRVMVGVSDQPSEDTTPVVSVWVQDDVDTPYQFRNWAHMVPGATLPAMPGPTVGADELAMDSTIGEDTLQSYVDNYLELLRKGEDDDLNETFAEDSYRDQLFTARGVLTAAAKKADGKYVDTVEPEEKSTYALATADGGALIFAPLRIDSSFSVEDAKVSVPAADEPLVDGDLVDKVTHEYRDMVVMYVPPADSEDLPAVVAADHHLVRVSPDGAK
ncbi:hypothetical protein [Demequina aurantiaca]|uniref:hypothetical protein n=1 Tax=Demequina aurantiaca TaxID=676200 RepID=UPI000AEFEB11|nr:hypothetical protein [Demequina aurantiaca]